MPGRENPRKSSNRPVLFNGWENLDPEKLSNMLRVTYISSSQNCSRNGILSILLALGHFFFFLAEPHNMWDISSLTRDQNCIPLEAES